MDAKQLVVSFGFVVAAVVAAPQSFAQGQLRQHDGPDDSDEFGSKVAICGDIDGDGTADYLVGAPGNGGPSRKGEAYAYSGASGALIWSWTGQFNGNAFGLFVSGAGDVDADGREDILVGAPNFPGPAQLKGKIYLYSGLTGASITTYTGGVGEQAGTVGALEDVDGDTVDDFIVGYPQSNSGTTAGGFTMAISGKSLGGIWKLPGSVKGGLLGSCFASVGDWNGDGVNDVAVGEPSSAVYGVIGSVYVLSGRDGSTIVQHTGSVTGFGSSVAGVGDLDGDGVRELLVGSPLENGGPGAAFLYSGKSLLNAFYGVGAYDQLGVSVSGGGDVNGDGIEDLILGAFDDAVIGASRGRFHVHSGDMANKFPLLTSLPGFADKDLYGTSVAGFALLDNNKLGDFLVGAPLEDGAGSDRGSVHVYKGDDLFLFPDKRGYFAGDTMTLDTRLGSPYQPALLFVATFAGTPLWLLIVSTSFDGIGDFAISGAVPAGLSGVDAEFASFGFDPGLGKYRGTTLVNVSFL